jgi:hypothetical protein
MKQAPISVRSGALRCRSANSCAASFSARQVCVVMMSPMNFERGPAGYFRRYAVPLSDHGLADAVGIAIFAAAQNDENRESQEPP